MNRKFILAMMLASGMAFAQTGSSGSTTNDQQASLRGCLKQAGGNWVLAADNGQSVNLQGDSSMLKPHDGHQVQVQGTRSSDGSLQVSSVNMISDSCTNNQAAGGAGAAAGTSAADQSASSAAAPASSASTASAPASASDQSAASPSTSASNTTPAAPGR